jgi:hypothetical protein
MKTLKSITSALAIVGLAATGVLAGEDAAQLPGSAGFTKYGEVEGWTVYVDTERGSCLIERIDEAENIVQMGLTKDKKFGYLGVFSKGDTGVRKGSQEDIYLDIDGVLFKSQATGLKGNITEGYSGGYILANNPVFIDAIRTKYVMNVFPRQVAAFSVDLKGTYKAMDMARKCNQEQG